MKKNKLGKILVRENLTILEAIKKLQELSLRCLIIVDKKKKLLGTINDGDIRRALIKKKKLNEKIKSVYFKNPYFIKNKVKVGRSDFHNNYSLIPILNSQGKVVNYIDNLRDKTIKEDNLILIMAGGKGLRMRPFTKFFSKSMLPIKKQTILDIILSKFYSSKFYNINLSINKKDKALKYHLSNSENNNPINLIEENKRLGTIGAASMIKNHPFKNCIITNCDIILNTNYRKILNTHLKKKNDLTMVVAKKTIQSPYGICRESNSRLVELIEKPRDTQLINVGFYIFKKDTIKFLKKNTRYDIQDIIKTLKKNKKRIGVYHIANEDWLDFGQWKEFNNSIKKID